MGKRMQTRIVVDGELTSVGFDTPLVRRPDGLWDVVGEQDRLFEPAPEQMPGQTSIWPEGFEPMDPNRSSWPL